MSKQKIFRKNMKILILGATFKEDCPDFRNSKSIQHYGFIYKEKNFF